MLKYGEEDDIPVEKGTTGSGGCVTRDKDRRGEGKKYIKYDVRTEFKGGNNM